MPSAPPISSTTTSISGSAAIAAASSYQRTADRSAPRSRRRSRADTAATMMRRPARWVSRSACRSSNCNTPDPTVPRPAMAILSGCFTTATRTRCATHESRRERSVRPAFFVALGRQFFDSVPGSVPRQPPQPESSRSASVFEQHLGAALTGILTLRRRLDLDFVWRNPRLGQSGGDRLSAIQSGSIAVQLLDRAACGSDIADDANLPRVLLVFRQDRFEGSPVLVGQACRIGAELDFGNRSSAPRRRL